MAKTGEELYAERDQRFNDAIAVKPVDRVPIFSIETYFPAKYAGVPKKIVHSDPAAWFEVFKEYLLEYQPDVNAHAIGADTAGSVKTAHALGYVQHKYPGYGLEDNTAFQFIEDQYMKAEEYDHFIDDPTDFLLRVYLPRQNKNLGALAMLPPLKLLMMGVANLTPLMLTPQFAAMFQGLNEAAVDMANRAAVIADFDRWAVENGFPAFNGAITLAPFDFLSDFFRGMRGTMLDIRRCPDKLLAAQEKLLPFTIGLAISGAQASGNPRVFIPLHRGADGFMSLKQFETFYWPFLKAQILALVDAGLTPMPFFEGRYDQRLEYLCELPAGKVLMWFDRTDVFRAREIMGNQYCIAGGMPVSLLETGPVEDVVALTKKLIDKVGKDGGYMMCPNTVLDEADPQLVKVWMDTTKEYGKY